MEKPYRVVIGLLLHEFWGHVQRRPLDGRQHHGVGGHGSGKPKVTQLHRPVGPDQHILRLHVPVDYAVRVQVVEGADQLLCHLLHDVLAEALVVLQDLKQLACAVSEPRVSALETCYSGAGMVSSKHRKGIIQSPS